MRKKAKGNDPNTEIIKRLDIIIAILLAQKGIDLRGIGKVLKTSHTSVQNMFPDLWTKVYRKDNK